MSLVIYANELVLPYIYTYTLGFRFDASCYEDEREPVAGLDEPQAALIVAQQRTRLAQQLSDGVGTCLRVTARLLDKTIVILFYFCQSALAFY